MKIDKTVKDNITKLVLDKMANKYGMWGDEINFEYENCEKKAVVDTIKELFKLLEAK